MAKLPKDPATVIKEDRKELKDIADELERLAEYIRNIADFGDLNDIHEMRRQGDIVRIRIRVGQIRYRLGLSA